MNVQDAVNLTIPEGSVRNIRDKNNQLLWSAVGYDVTYRGDTTQQTYTGKNLASIKTSSQTVVGGLAFTIEEGTIKINGTTSQQSDAFFFDSFQTNNGVARFWVDVTGYTDEESDNAYIVLQISDDGSSWSTGAEINLKSTAQHVKNITLDSSKYYRIRFYVKNNTFTNSVIKFQLEYGTTVTPFEPYVGGVPSPNPNYPQIINVVTGTQTITLSDGTVNQDYTVDLGSIELCKIGDYQDYIFKSSGKNLFNGILESGLINGNTGENIPNASYIRSKDFIPVSENTTYTLSAKDYPDAYYFWYEYKSDYTYNLTQNKTSKEGTFTTNPGTAFVRFRFTTDFTDTSTPTQLEKGSMATPYEPYGTGWYVRKEIKNMTFSGIQPSSVVEVSGLQGGVVYVDNKIWGQLGAKCNKATLVRRNQGESVFDGAFYENNANFVFMGNATDTLATLRIKYANSILYYIGSSFSDILITDATLIGQLNAVHDWLRRYDYYGVVSGNLPIIINRSGII